MSTGSFAVIIFAAEKLLTARENGAKRKEKISHRARRLIAIATARVIATSRARMRQLKRMQEKRAAASFSFMMPPRGYVYSLLRDRSWLLPSRRSCVSLETVLFFLAKVCVKGQNVAVRGCIKRRKWEIGRGKVDGISAGRRYCVARMEERARGTRILFIEMNGSEVSYTFRSWRIKIYQLYLQFYWLFLRAQVCSE